MTTGNLRGVTEPAVQVRSRAPSSNSIMDVSVMRPGSDKTIPTASLKEFAAEHS